jgi:hypothetical protein
MACKPMPSSPILSLVVESHRSLHLTSSMAVVSDPYLKAASLVHSLLGKALGMRDSQKKYTAPAAPSKRMPTGAEFHPSDLMWKPRYDRYRMMAVNFCQVGGPLILRYPNTCDDMRLPMMKIPRPLMKKATVGKA